MAQFANPANSLFAGTYTVTVTDANGCEVVESVTVSEPAQLSLAIDGNDVSCFGETTGNALVNVAGGTLPYTYAWDNGPTTANNDNISAGNYFVTITDGNGCQQDTFISIGEPMMPLSTAIGQNLIGCFAASQGVAEVIPSGGTGLNYTFEWSSGATDAIASDLNAGWHFVTITDENNCTILDSILIQEFEAITGNLIMIEPTCHGSEDGQIGINIVTGE